MTKKIPQNLYIKIFKIYKKLFFTALPLLLRLVLPLLLHLILRLLLLLRIPLISYTYSYPSSCPYSYLYSWSCSYRPILPFLPYAQMFQLLVGSLNSKTKKSPNLFYQIYQIPASLKVFITPRKLPEQKLISPVKSQIGQLSIYIYILNHVNFEIIFILFWCTINSMIFFGTV